MTYNYWAPYGSGSADPSGAYGSPYGAVYDTAENSTWALGGERYAKSARANRSPEEYEGVRKRHISDYDGCVTDLGSKRQTYVLEVDMHRTVANVVSDRALKCSSRDKISVIIGLLDQYVISP